MPWVAKISLGTACSCLPGVSSHQSQELQRRYGSRGAEILEEPKGVSDHPAISQEITEEVELALVTM